MKRKKVFPCGCRGFGSYCHRCAQEKAKAQQKATVKTYYEKLQDECGIDFADIPREVIDRTADIVYSLRRGADYTAFKGKRLNYDRGVVSIPVGRSYRLVCITEDGCVVPKELLSHEEYNKRIDRR